MEEKSMTQKQSISEAAKKYKDDLGMWDYHRIRTFCGDSKTLKEYMLDTHTDTDTYDFNFDTIVTVCDYYDSPFPKEGDNDYYYYRFCDYIMSNVNVVKEETSETSMICDYSEFVYRNYNKLRDFSKKRWVADYKDVDDFTEEWIEEIHGYLAGYASEDVYKEFLEYMEKPDNEPNKIYADYINQEILKLPYNKAEYEKWIFTCDKDNDYSGEMLNAELEKLVGRKKMPHDNKIYNQEILMEFAGYSKGEDEYSLHNDMTGDIVHFKNNDELYDYLVNGLSSGEGEANLYSYDKKPDLLIERVEHFEFDRIS